LFKLRVRLKSRQTNTYAHARDPIPLWGRWHLLIAAAVVLAGGGTAVISLPELRTAGVVSARLRPVDPVLTASHQNTAGGYRFRYPFGWHLSGQGAISEVMSPERDAVVSFGVGGLSGTDRAESLSSSLNKVIDLIGETYSDMKLTDIGSQSIAGNPAVVREGLATNEAGGLVRFSLIVVQDSGRNFVIVTFEPARLVSVEVHSTLMEVVESFVPMAPGDSAD
jgi:hypothetical protein